MKTENKKQLYEFTKDYPLSGNKKGDRISLKRVGPGVKNFVKAVSSTTASEEEEEEIPTEKSTKEEILAYLFSKGVSEAQGTKEDLLKIVKKVSK